MQFILAAALVWRLVIMPTGGIKTEQTKELFKPFDVPSLFASEADCRDFARLNLLSLLAAHGLPNGTGGNFVCTVN